MKKAKLQLSRTTVQRMSAAQASDVHGGMGYPSATCKSILSACCPKHSVFDSCYNTDCCLIVPGTD